MDADYGPLFDLISGYDDGELLVRLRAMEDQLPLGSFSRLAAVPSVLAILQRILDRAEEDGSREEGVLDEVRNMVQRVRSYVTDDLRQALVDFRDLHQQLSDRGLANEAAQAQVAIERLAEMQRSERVVQGELPGIDDLYGTLLSPLIYNR